MIRRRSALFMQPGDREPGSVECLAGKVMHAKTLNPLPAFRKSLPGLLSVTVCKSCPWFHSLVSLLLPLYITKQPHRKNDIKTQPMRFLYISQSNSVICLTFLKNLINFILKISKSINHTPKLTKPKDTITKWPSTHLGQILRMEDVELHIEFYPLNSWSNTLTKTNLQKFREETTERKWSNDARICLRGLRGLSQTTTAD